ncbi:pyruvate formate lyase family protein [Thermodesulfobacteriota bacterium]
MVTTGQAYQQEIESIDLNMPRLEALRQAYYDSKVHICPERSHLATESWKESEGQPLHLRRAKLFEKICDEIPVAIFDHELIVGSQTQYRRGAGLWLDFSPKVGLEIEKGNRALRAVQATGILSEEELNTITEDAHYWQGRSPGDVMLQQIKGVMGPIYEDITYDVCSRAHGSSTSYAQDADYKKVLKMGLRGIIAEIDEAMAELQFTSPQDGRKFQFLRAAKICCEAEIRLAKRYAELARQMSSGEADRQRKKELETIAEVCEHVPENPSRTLREALQSVRFIQLGIYLEDGNGAGASLGRLDQYLYSFYKSDLEQGKMTRQQAAELLTTFWLKLVAMESAPPIQERITTAGYRGTKVILGGVDRDGKDAGNELTYLILHVAGQTNIIVPLYMRWHAGISRELMLKAVWTNIQVGSEPAFHNDEQVIPGLVADGASLEDARDYVLWACSHPHPFGSVYGTPHYPNGGKVLELVLYNGYDPRMGKQLGIQTGDPRRFSSIDDWIDAFMKQWEQVYDIVIRGYNIGELTQMEVYSQPFVSALTPDCIRKGLGVHEGGCRYPQFVGDIYNKVYADVPDSLIAIKELVYKEKKITLDELLQACANNFEGERGEYIRDLLTSAPKYGNDFGEPEEMYRLLNNRVAAVGWSRKGYFGAPKRDLKSGATHHISHGRVVGALPNGRKAGMPLADGGISPSTGCDVKGPTVTLRSVAKAVDFNTNRSAILNQKIPKELLKTKEQKNRFVDLIETFFRDYNGYQVQWNIQDRDVYIAAKSNPEEYKNLIVRVGGYSAYFIELDPVLQEQIIARTEQKFEGDKSIAVAG